MGARPAEYEKVFIRKRLSAFLDSTVTEVCVEFLRVR